MYIYILYTYFIFQPPIKVPEKCQNPPRCEHHEARGCEFHLWPRGPRGRERGWAWDYDLDFSHQRDVYISTYVVFLYIVWLYDIYIYICIHKYDMIPFIHVFIYIYIYRNVIKPGENLRLASKYHQPVMNLKTDLFSQTHVPERSRRRGVVVHKLSIIIFPCAIFLSAYELYKKSFRLGSDGRIPFQPWRRRQDYFYVRY